jgi:hypothetical protein
MKRRTDVDVGLVTSEGGVVPDAVHPPASALRAEGILDRVDAALVPEGRACSALENSREARHCVEREMRRGDSDTREAMAMARWRWRRSDGV